MDAIISGRAGVAFLIEGEVFSSFDVEDPGTLLPRRRADLRLFFGEAPDLEFFEDVNHEAATRHLERAFNCASALDLALILFDPELTDDLRDDAAEELERLISEQAVADYLENVLYARPLPAAADLPGALARCADGRLPKLSATLQIFEGYQPSIRAVRAAWDALPARLFGGEQQKADFQHAAVREGLFRQLTIEVAGGPRARLGDFIIRSLTNRSITALGHHREVIKNWTSPFQTHTAAPRIGHEAEDFSEEAYPGRKDKRKRRGRGSAEEKLNKLQGQLDLIVAAMQQRNLPLARKITDQVINYQLETTKPVNAAKTLCNLATEAKACGMYPFQLELTERAIQIAPDDGWSWAQYADALRQLQRHTEALKAYEQSYAFGHGVSAKNGYAEVLKALGRFNDALATYNESITLYPRNVIAKSGRAETLRAMGRLNEALAAYNSAIAQHPENLVARSGRAETLRAMGRLNEALAAYDSIIIEHPEDVIGKNGRAETLRAMGRLNEALAAYDSAIAQHPESIVARNGRAETLRAMGRLPEALAAYDSIVAQHPEDVVGKNGRAEALRAMGRLPEALAAYDSTIAQHPESIVARNGRAETLRAMGRLNEALAAYDSAIAQHPGDVFAKNGRAETLRAMGRLNEALAAYDSAIAQHPTDVVAKSGRAETLRAMGRLPEALAAYDSAIAQHPTDVVAKSGRAEALRALNRLPEALAAYDSTIAQHPGDVVGKNGRAETLRAMGRLNEALAAYDSAIAEHPGDLVARRGRAEVLKVLGRLDEALAAYNSVLAENPQDIITISGRSCVLVAMRRYDEALRLLPENPSASGHWIAYHIRGMILLRMGKVDDAIRTFERGVKEDPFPSSREYFRNALAVACLRRGDFARAEDALEGVNEPLLQPQANVLRLHKHGAKGEDEPAIAAYEALREKPWFIPDELIVELHRKYILKEEPRHDDDWVFEKEIDTFLFDPNQQLLSYASLVA